MTRIVILRYWSLSSRGDIPYADIDTLIDSVPIIHQLIIKVREIPRARRPVIGRCDPR